MQIKVKFKVGDLVKQKFDSNRKHEFSAMEILEVVTSTCYSGTQVFYYCRHLFAKKEFDSEYKKEGDFVWMIGHSINNKNSSKMGWHKYRDDELIKSPEGDQAIIKGLLVGNNE